MCGIAGYHGNPSNWQVAPRTVLQRMVAAIRHRGPDDSGVHVGDGIGLAHARLSIIDLAGGQQPMADDRQTVWVTYNGEIFNYVELKEALIQAGCRFRTSSDTEVLLQAYAQRGPDCVLDFNGDFAFALWDQPRRRLMLARDRMGVRPVYYTFANGVLAFASEIKALLQVPGVRAEIDPIALAQCFTLWFPLAPRTPFKGIHELPPGHMLLAEPGSVTVKPYWQPAYPPAHEAPRQHPSADDLADELWALLVDATRIRLRADVPVGAYLSGGLDSSAVTAMIKQVASGSLRTFSVRFQEEEFDETPYQQQVARFLQCDHESELIQTREIGQCFPDVVRHMERPVLRTAPAPLYRLASLVRRNQLKVVLTGEGADELFGGYDIFKEAKVRRFWARQPHSAWRPRLLERLYHYLPALRRQSPAYLQTFFKVGLDRTDDPLFSHLPRWSVGTTLGRFLSDDYLASLNGYDPLEELRHGLPREFKTWHPLSQAQYLETAHLLPGYILSAQGDRVAMAHAVEGRFPFLDHRVVQFAADLPPRLKLRGLTEKYLLRRSVQRHLPEKIAARPKQPYRAPDSQSFFGNNAPDYVEEMLSPGAVATAGYFDPRSVEKLLLKCRKGEPMGFRDNMALIGILSVQLLDQCFVRGTKAAYPWAAGPSYFSSIPGGGESKLEPCAS
jgi:asparagine synthase (glutamine-hydrolysing)